MYFILNALQYSFVMRNNMPWAFLDGILRNEVLSVCVGICDLLRSFVASCVERNLLDKLPTHRSCFGITHGS